jgi:hypothetical protein
VKADGGQTPSGSSTTPGLYVLKADELHLVKSRQKNREDVIISAGSKLIEGFETMQLHLPHDGMEG